MKNSAVSVKALKAPASKTQLTLDRVVVKGLFDQFDYDINFKNGYDVSILIAPNGCGKTTIFRLIRFAFNNLSPSDASLLRIPFEKVECTLSNGYTVTLKPRKRQGVRQWITILKHGNTVVQRLTVAKEGKDGAIYVDPVGTRYDMLKSHGCDLNVVMVTEAAAEPSNFMATAAAIANYRRTVPEAQFKSVFERFAKTINYWFRVTKAMVELSEHDWVIKRAGTQVYGNHLSHGERQAMTLLAYQVFTVLRNKKPDLLLFDLPETGMHIEWQREYLDILLDTCECNKQQAVITTHSPAIINGHFDLYCDRKVTHCK